MILQVFAAGVSDSVKRITSVRIGFEVSVINQFFAFGSDVSSHISCVFRDVVWSEPSISFRKKTQNSEFNIFHILDIRCSGFRNAGLSMCTKSDGFCVIQYLPSLKSIQFVIFAIPEITSGSGIYRYDNDSLGTCGPIRNVMKTARGRAECGRSEAMNERHYRKRVYGSALQKGTEASYRQSGLHPGVAAA